MIYATVNMTVGDYSSTCDQNIVLYRGDKNVEIRFVIKGNRFTVLDSTYAQMIIRRPSSVSIFSEPAAIQNDTVIFTITEDMVDELKEVGEYTFQIRLYDNSMNARATLPPCNNCLIINQPIATEGEALINAAMINDSAVLAAVSDIPEEEIFTEDNAYNRTVWVDGDIITDVRMNKIENALYYINEKGGGGTATAPYISTSLPETVMVGSGEDFELDLDFSSPNLGKGTLKVFINDVDSMNLKIDQGMSITTIPGSLFSKGTNMVVIYVLDRVGMMSNSLTFYVRYGGTEVTSTFDAYVSYDYGATVRYYFTPTALDTSLQLTFYMEIDGVTQNGIPCMSDVRSYYTFPTNLAVGNHYCRAWVTDGTTRSNVLTFNLIILDATSLVVATDTLNPTVEEGTQLVLDYKVYMKNNTSFITKTYIDGNLVNTGTCTLETAYYRTTNLTEGTHTIKVEVFDVTETYTDFVTWTVTVTESTYTMLEPAKAGSIFMATAYNKSNVDENREEWIGSNQDDEDITASLSNFSFNSENGWIDDALVISGNSWVEIPIQPLANNAQYGFTLDIEFKTKAIGVEDAEVLTLWNETDNCGIKITTEQLIMRSKTGNQCDLYFAEDEIVSAIFVIDRDEKTAKIYLNGVMCEAFALSDYEAAGQKYLEDFTVNGNVYLGGYNKNGYCAIKNIRIYEVALATNEILNNFMSNEKDKEAQRELVEFQKGNTLPTLTVYCDFSGLGKDDKKPCNIVYNSPDVNLYGESFTLDGKYSQLQYQGTSSMQYPIKNYRLNPRDENGKVKLDPFNNGVAESRFTLKADFMSSGHWQNTGMAKFVNDCLYNYNPNDEKSMNPAKWWSLQNGGSLKDTRETINGFPCRLILVNDGETALNEGQQEPTPGNTKDMGIFNFNNDKDNVNTLGLDTEIFPNCISYEVTANSDTSAGAFVPYDGTDSAEELSYLQNSFELRYPDEDDVGKDYGYLGMETEVLKTDYYVAGGETVYWSNQIEHDYFGSNELVVSDNVRDVIGYNSSGTMSVIQKVDGKVNIKTSSDYPYIGIRWEEPLTSCTVNGITLYAGEEVNTDTIKKNPYVEKCFSTDHGLKRLIDWVGNCSNEEFKADFEKYFNKQYVLRYYLLVIVCGMVDNLGKNMMLDTWDGQIWYPRFYDMDTICSYDNSGEIKFDVDIEMAQGYWNTSSSRLWTKVRDLFHDELVETYNNMRQNNFSYEKFMSYFYDKQIAQIPQTYYNKDYDVKYAPYANEYMGKAHGDGYEHLKRWLKRRLIFTDTLFDYAPSYTNDALTIRANTLDLMSLEIETYTPVYQHVSFYNGNMEKIKIDGKTATTFTGTAQTATDQEVLIYGGSNIKSIKGIQSMNPNSMLIGNATRLTELDLSNCPILSVVNSNKANFAPHTYLNKLNISNCPQLGGTLNVSNSPLLQELNALGSAVDSILFPTSVRNLETLRVPKTVTSLNLTDAGLLYTIEMEEGNNLQNISLTNCNNLTETINFDLTQTPTVLLDNSFNGEEIYMSATTNLTLKNMPSLKRVIFTPNSEYSAFDINNVLNGANYKITTFNNPMMTDFITTAPHRLSYNGDDVEWADKEVEVKVTYEGNLLEGASELKEGYYVSQSNGTIGSTTSVKTLEDYIPVIAEEIYTFEETSSYDLKIQIVFYKEDKTYTLVEGESYIKDKPLPYTFTVPKGYSYLRFHVANSSNSAASTPGLGISNLTLIGKYIALESQIIQVKDYGDITPNTAFTANTLDLADTQFQNVKFLCTTDIYNLKVPTTMKNFYCDSAFDIDTDVIEDASYEVIHEELIEPYTTNYEGEVCSLEDFTLSLPPNLIPSSANGSLIFNMYSNNTTQPTSTSPYMWDLTGLKLEDFYTYGMNNWVKADVEAIIPVKMDTRCSFEGNKITFILENGTVNNGRVNVTISDGFNRRCIYIHNISLAYTYLKNDTQWTQVTLKTGLTAGVEYKLIVDLDKDTMEFYLDGTLQYQGIYSNIPYYTSDGSSYKEKFITVNNESMSVKSMNLKYSQLNFINENGEIKSITMPQRMPGYSVRLVNADITPDEYPTMLYPKLIDTTLPITGKLDYTKYNGTSLAWAYAYTTGDVTIYPVDSRRQEQITNDYNKLYGTDFVDIVDVWVYKDTDTSKLSTNEAITKAYIELTNDNYKSRINEVLKWYPNCTDLYFFDDGAVTTLDDMFNNSNNNTYRNKIKKIEFLEGYFQNLTSLSYSFYNCTSLTDIVNIPSGVTNMSNAFYNCSKLVIAPNIPTSVHTLSSTFQGCSALTTPPSIIPKSVTNTSSCFNGCSSLVTPPEFEHVDGSDLYPGRMYQNCSKMTTAPKIPNGVDNILGMFVGCKALTIPPTIPDSVTNMQEVFNNCTGLTQNPNVPTGVTNLKYAFSNSSITAITIPLTNLTTYDYAVSKCPNLTNVTWVGEITNTFNVKNLYYRSSTDNTTPTATDIQELVPEHLGTVTGKTLTLGDYINHLSEDEIAAAVAKGWTIE